MDRRLIKKDGSDDEKGGSKDEENILGRELVLTSSILEREEKAKRNVPPGNFSRKGQKVTGAKIYLRQQEASRRKNCLVYYC